jgi:hypothetical protein
MLFDMGFEQIIQVTTVPMLFPLDIAFLSETMVVTEIYRNVLPGYLVTSTSPARYFLEVNAGELDGVNSGSRTSFEFLAPESTVAASDWVTPMISFMGFTMMGIFTVGMVASLTRSVVEAASSPFAQAMDYCPWIKNPCNYRKFIPASWDDSIWYDLCHLLRNDEWLEGQLGEEQNRLQDKDKLIQLEEDKIKQAKQKLIRIQDGWEKGVYTEAEAGVKVKELRQIIVNAEQEIENINTRYMRENFNLDSLRQELLSLRSKNLEEAASKIKQNLSHVWV